MKIQYFLIIPILALVGCTNPLTGLFKDKGKSEKEIAEIKRVFAQENEAKIKEIQATLNSVIASKEKQIAAGSNSLYAADLTFKTIAKPVRTDIITNNYVNEGWTSLGKGMPDAATMIKINDRLKTELDETKTSLDDLQNAHNTALIEAQKLSDNVKALEAKLKEAEKQYSDLKDNYSKTIEIKTNQLLETNNKIIQLEKARADDRAAIQATKQKLSMIAGGIALLCIAGAVYSPVFKMEIATFGGICAIASVGILFVEGWMIAVAIGVAGLGFIARATLKHHNEEKLSDALVLGLQDAKNSSKEKWTTDIKPFIEERLKKYVKTSNGIKTVPDQKLEAQIEKKLVDWEVK